MLSLDFDEVLHHIGEFGWYQRAVAFLLFLIEMTVSSQLLIPFTAIEPAWACHDNRTSCPLNGTLPGTNTLRCRIPRQVCYDCLCIRRCPLYKSYYVHFNGRSINTYRFKGTLPCLIVRDRYFPKKIFTNC